MTFQDHFSGHAQVYARARPTYPDALFKFLASCAEENEVVWDCATGNGQSALALANYFSQVIATDASAEQLAQAAQKSNIDYRVAPAEAHTLLPASADLVTVSQALHWFNIERFFKAADKALKPNGLLAIWSYGIHSIDPAVDEVINRLYRGTLNGYWTPERAMVEEGYKAIDFPYEAIEHPEFSMSLEWSQAQVADYLRSWSAVQKYLKVNGIDPVAEMLESLSVAWGSDESKTILWPLTLILRRKPER